MQIARSEVRCGVLSRAAGEGLEGGGVCVYLARTYSVSPYFGVNLDEDGHRSFAYLCPLAIARDLRKEPMNHLSYCYVRYILP